MNITKILELEKTERFDDEYNGQKYWFEVKVNAITPRFYQRFADINHSPIGLAENLADVLTAWSLFMEKEGDFPPTLANIEKVPSKFLWRMVSKITATWSGDEADKKKLASG